MFTNIILSIMTLVAISGLMLYVARVMGASAEASPLSPMVYDEALRRLHERLVAVEQMNESFVAKVEALKSSVNSVRGQYGALQKKLLNMPVENYDGETDYVDPQQQQMDLRPRGR